MRLSSLSCLFRGSVFSIAVLSLACIVLSGCGTGTIDRSVSSAALGTMKGRVLGGQQPVSGATVQLWVVGTSGYGSAATALGTPVMTAADGSFTYGTYTCDPSDPDVYITASGGTANGTAGANANILLAAGLADCDSAPNAVVNINEVSTVATAFALGQFFGGPAAGDSFGGPSDSVGLPTSNRVLIPTLINVPLGTVNANVAATPSTMGVTLEAAKIYSMANTLAACVNDDDPSFPQCATLYNNTTNPNTTTAPVNTLEAAVNLSLFPYQNVTSIYNQGAVPNAPFVGLSSAPNDWTVGVAYTSETFGLSVPGASSPGSVSIDIDSDGDIWFPSDNTTTGAGIGIFVPSTPSFYGPFGTGYATLPQYVALDTNDDVFMTDSQSASFTVISAFDGSFEYNELFAGAATLGPIALDVNSNAYLAYTDISGNYAAGAFVGTDVPDAGIFTYAPASVAVDSLGDMLAATGGVSAGSSAAQPCALEGSPNSGTASSPAYSFSVYAVSTASPCFSGGIVAAEAYDDYLTTASTANEVCSFLVGVCATPGIGLNQPEGIATDGLGYEWVANAADGSVFELGSVVGGLMPPSTLEYQHGTGAGGTATNPYGIAIDGSGNIWLANASCAACSSPSSFTLTEIVGVAAPTITPLAEQLNTAPGTEPMVLRRGMHATAVDNRPGSLRPTPKPGVSRWASMPKR